MSDDSSEKSPSGTSSDEEDTGETQSDPERSSENSRPLRNAIAALQAMLEDEGVDEE